MNLSQYSTEKYRWYALVVLAIGLAIVIIDNTVLNVAIPYILRDLNASLDSIQWVVSGYALIIATLLIAVGRLGDIIGRKKVFMMGTVLFAIGSLIASFAHSSTTLFIGEAVIEAIGAAMMLTTSLSLLTAEFVGHERAIAFGVWGSVAGASATIGPLLGGYFTTYYSWRWSLRINVLVAVIAILGSVFIQESKGEGEKSFDWQGTILSGFGLFSLVFGLIEGQKYGWWHAKELFMIGNWHWVSDTLSVVPVAFALALIFLTVFVIAEYEIERKGGVPLLRMSMFKNRGFSTGLFTLMIVSLGQFGIFFILPIFLQTVLGLDALHTGYALLSTSIAVFIFGPLSGFIASRLSLKWVVTIGMIICAIGIYWVKQSLGVDATQWTLAPGLVLFGIGIGSTGSQLTNIILSSVPLQFAGEASAANTTVRQIGTSIGIAIIGVVLATNINTKIASYVNDDTRIPDAAKVQIVDNLQHADLESGQQNIPSGISSEVVEAIKNDVKKAESDSTKKAMLVALISVALGAIFAFFIPDTKTAPKVPTPTAH